MANGILILVVSLAILTHVLRQKRSLLTKLSLLATALVAIAVAGGLIFLLRSPDDSLSMAMAMSFIFIYTIAFYELYLIGRIEAPRKS